MEKFQDSPSLNAGAAGGQRVARPTGDRSGGNWDPASYSGTEFVLVSSSTGDHRIEKTRKPYVMKLFHATASPFVRKVMVLAIETGVVDRIEVAGVALAPTSPDADVCAGNPVGKIPTLVRDDGSALYDSRVICEYLDGLHAGPRMFPTSGEARWTALRRQALADGIMDAAVSTRYETFLRPEPYRWADWVDGQMSKVRRGLDALETESLGDTLDIGTIAIGCALGYLDFRYPEEGWRDSRPGLAGWFEKASTRPSMTRTVPE